MLRSKGITVVLATGRSFFSLRKVIPENFPADFFIISSGAGIVDSTSAQLLFQQPFTSDQVRDICQRLTLLKHDYMVHGRVPFNHKFVYHRHGVTVNPDFERRVSLYRQYCYPVSKVKRLPKTSAQIIAIMPDDTDRFNRTAADFPDYQVVRATSPLDHHSIWMEIYPKGVSKGTAARWLCDHLGIGYSTSFGIGNDYNDIELLNFTAISYVVSNAPADLKCRYKQAPSNDRHGVYQAILAGIGKAPIFSVGALLSLYNLPMI